jgi:3-oxoacyl-[acyl-carrier protein] reductase
LTDENYQDFQGNVTSASDVNEVMSQLRSEWKSLDVLINNAGIARMIPFALTPPETAQEVMEVNYLGTFTVTHAAIRLLRKSSHGSIVNLSSVAVPLRLEGEISYAAAKAAVEEFTRIAAKELAEFRITCNAVGPSPIQTDLIRNVAEEKIQSLLKKQAIAQMATLADVANVIDFFVSENSRMVTGQVIYLGGVG